MSLEPVVIWAILALIPFVALYYWFVGRTVLSITIISGSFRRSDMTRSAWLAGFWTVAFIPVVWLPSPGDTVVFMAALLIGTCVFRHLTRVLHSIRIGPREIEGYSEQVSRIRQEALALLVSEKGGQDDPKWRQLIAFFDVDRYTIGLGVGGSYMTWRDGDRIIPASEVVANLPSFTDLLSRVKTG